MINNTEYTTLKRLRGKELTETEMLFNIPPTIDKDKRTTFIRGLVSDNLVIHTNFTNTYAITNLGLDEMRDYDNNLKKQKEVNDQTLEKLVIDTTNAKRVFKTYWWTFSFSILALLISLALLVLKLIEPH